jgi:hypothetical protein
MAIVKKSVKKAKVGAVCGPGKGIRCAKTPGTGRFKGGNSGGGLKVGNPFAKLKEAREEEKTKRINSGRGEVITRDFPGDVSPGGFPGDKGGDKNTKWTDKDSKLTRVDKKKSGGKIAKKSVVKKSSIKKSKKK